MINMSMEARVIAVRRQLSHLWQTIVYFSVVLLVMGNHSSTSEYLPMVRTNEHPPDPFMFPNFSFDLRINRKTQDDEFFNGANNNGNTGEDLSNESTSNDRNINQNIDFDSIFKSFVKEDMNKRKMDDTEENHFSESSFIRKEKEGFAKLSLEDQIRKVIQLKKAKAKWESLSPGLKMNFRDNTRIKKHRLQNPIDDMSVEDLENLVEDLRSNPGKEHEFTDESKLTDEEKIRRNEEHQEFLEEWNQLSPEMKREYIASNWGGKSSSSNINHGNDDEEATRMQEKYRNYMNRWQNYPPEMKEQLRNEFRKRQAQIVNRGNDDEEVSAMHEKYRNYMNRWQNYPPEMKEMLRNEFRRRQAQIDYDRMNKKIFRPPDSSIQDLEMDNDYDERYNRKLDCEITSSCEEKDTLNKNTIQNDHDINEANHESAMTYMGDDHEINEKRDPMWGIPIIQTENYDESSEKIDGQKLQDVNNEESFVDEKFDLWSDSENIPMEGEFKDTWEETDSNRRRRETYGTYNGQSTIKEGSAEILVSETKKVFYNKVQEFNRDMSVAALTVFSKMYASPKYESNDNKNVKRFNSSDYKPGIKTEGGLLVLEPLSATGLRSIRYAKEVPGIKQVVACDISEDAVENIRENVKHNGVESLVTITKDDAKLLMYRHVATNELFDVIDIDPFGSPSQFLDIAVQTVRSGGMLMVTCTDMYTLAGNTPEQCYVKYNAIPLNIPACHEMALRIVLQSIQAHAGKYSRYIVPLLSFRADFYIRVMVQVYTSPIRSKLAVSKISTVYQCCGCDSFTLKSLGSVVQGPDSKPIISLLRGPPVDKRCSHCDKMHHIGGPIWAGAMNNDKFLENMLKLLRKNTFSTKKRMLGMLTVIQKELSDQPLYYNIDHVCKTVHSPPIPQVKLKSAILNAGYRVSGSHCNPNAIKTDAPAEVIFDIMKCWMQYASPPNTRTPNKVAAAIMKKPPKEKADFSIHPDAQIPKELRNLVRYQRNPEKNWGPGSRP